MRYKQRQNASQHQAVNAAQLLQLYVLALLYFDYQALLLQNPPGEGLGAVHKAG